MRGIFIRRTSPYYWLRYYDATVHEAAKRRKEHNTKIEVIASDKKRFDERTPGEKVQIQGTPQLWRKVKELKIALADRKFEKDTHSQINSKLTLSEGYEEFKRVRTVPGSKKELKAKTLVNYKLAVDKMITVCGDKCIYKYSASKDYIALLHFFEEKNLSINTRSIYTRALKSLWNYFVKKAYTNINIIEPVEEEEKDPDPIPLNEMVTIINYFKFDKKYPHHYWIIYFMLLTGCRPSSAIMQLKEDINFKNKTITIKNVKTGRTKKKLSFKFPLFKELEKLIREMGVKDGDNGRLFDMFAVTPGNYTWPLSFWKRGIGFLLKGKKINRQYILKQIRPTSISFLINIMKIDIYTVYKLADHTDIEITDKNYIDFRLTNVRKILDEVTIDTFLEDPD